MISVFYCTAAKDELRKAIAYPCLMMWRLIADPVIIEPPSGMCGKHFQSWRRWQAEMASETPWYILADDDCMPLGNDFMERCEDVAKRHSQFAILGTEDYCAPYGKDEVYETSTAGGINVVRKGILEIPEFKGTVWDGCAQGEQIRRKGFKIGRMRDVRRNHFGDGLSTVWPDGYKSGLTQIGYLSDKGVLV